MSSSFVDHRLPRGRHGIPREQVLANQHWRLLGACAEVLAERGYAATTVSAVAEVAGVSKIELYRHFDDLPRCVLATYEVAAGNLLALAREACSTTPATPAHAPFPIPSVLALLAAEPGFAQLLCNPAVLDIPEVLDAHTRLVGELAGMLAVVRGEAEEGYSDERAPLSLHLVQGTLGWLNARLCSEGAATPSPCTRALITLWCVPPEPKRSDPGGRLR